MQLSQTEIEMVCGILTTLYRPQRLLVYNEMRRLCIIIGKVWRCHCCLFERYWLGILLDGPTITLKPQSVITIFRLPSDLLPHSDLLDDSRKEIVLSEQVKVLVFYIRNFLIQHDRTVYVFVQLVPLAD